MYLERRRRKWYALHDIPEAVQEKLGAPGKPKRRFVQSLDTDSKSLAKIRAVPLEAQWRRVIEETRGTIQPDPVERQARYWRHKLQNASGEERQLILDMLSDEARQMVEAGMEKRGISDYQDPRAEEVPEIATAERLVGIATGAIVRFDEHLEEYLATLRNQPKSIDLKRSSIKRFETKFPYLSDVTRKEVQGWINGLSKSHMAVATIRRQISELRGYWSYLVSLQLVPEEPSPFEKLTFPKQPKNANDSRLPFAPEEVVTLLNAAVEREDAALADVIRLGMWTGARIESLCALKVTDVKSDAFYIADDKSAAGRRTVPIHSELKPTVERLLKASKDGYLVSGQPENKYGDRSNAVGKRFGRLKTSLGFGTDHVYHSIRKTVATLLDNAGVPENVAADIVGHEKPTMTYGLYSGGSSLEVKRAAIEKLAYPSRS